MGRGGKFSLATGHLRTTHEELCYKGSLTCRVWHSPNTGPRILRPHPTDVGCVFMIPHNQRTFRLGGVVPRKVENLGPISIPRVPSGGVS